MPQITISGHPFEVADRYAEGHTLTANEALALNQMRRENIRNNTAKKVKEFVDGGGNAADFQAQLDEITAAYEFGARTVGGASTASRDPVAVEARAIARSAVNAAIKAAGKKRKDFSDEQYNAAVEKAAAREDILAQAQERVAQKQSIAAVDLGDLDTVQPTSDEQAATPKKGRNKQTEATA